MKNIVASVLLVLVAACGKKEDSPELRPFTYSYSTHGTFAGKRAFLAHGYTGSAKDYLTAAGLNAIHQGLIDRGYQVVLFSYPLTLRKTFSNAGADYRQKYSEFLSWMIDDVEAAHGAASETLFGGVSLGGLHTFMAVSLNAKIDRWFVVLPVVDIAALKEFRGLDTAQFNALNEAAALSTRPGFILYDNTDERVNWRLTEDLVEALQGADVRVELRTGHGHRMNVETAQRVLDWI